MKKGEGVFNPVADFRRAQRKGASRWQDVSFPDIWLMVAWLALMAVGVVMVTSASMTEAVSHNQSPYFYVVRQLVFCIGSLILAYIFFTIPTYLFQEHSAKILVATIILLLALYIPGVGVRVNGSTRWLNVLVFNLQVGEVAKLAIILYAADFLQRHNQRLDHSWIPMLMLLGITAIVALILITQPDFGTTAVIVTTVCGMMFMAGVCLKRFFTLAVVVVMAMAGILISADYRRERLLTFLDPWANPFDTGYQLTNSLIAIASGGWFGRGLGESVQKHQFLPEAHTDFIFAIITEELGLIGALVVIALYVLLVWRAFAIGLLADKVRKRFASNVAYGIGLWIGIQALVNIGVTSGALPTKGLTLPLISYGGSSMMVTCVALAILLRIDAQSRFQAKREGLL